MHTDRLVQASPLIEEAINRRFDPKASRSIFLRALADRPMRRNNDHIGCFEAASPGSGHDTGLPHIHAGDEWRHSRECAPTSDPAAPFATISPGLPPLNWGSCHSNHNCPEERRSYSGAG